MKPSLGLDRTCVEISVNRSLEATLVAKNVFIYSQLMRKIMLNPLGHGGVQRRTCIYSAGRGSARILAHSD